MLNQRCVLLLKFSFEGRFLYWLFVIKTYILPNSSLSHIQLIAIVWFENVFFYYIEVIDGFVRHKIQGD